MKFFLLTLLFFCLVFTRLDRHFFKKNESFSPSFIIPKWSHCPQLETKAPEGIKEILNQPFTYLTKGKQSFVFISQDEQWVLKFIRLPRYAKRNSLKGKKSNLEHFFKTFESFKWATEELKNETGVIYAHLKPTHFLNQNITLIDTFGIKYVLDLDILPFAIQKYGKPFFCVFDPLDQNAAKKVIAKTISLFAHLHRRGFIDRDPIFDKNFGICENAPFIMDVGQLEKSENLPPLKEYILEMTQSLRGNLARESPELCTYYHSLIKNLLH